MPYKDPEQRRKAVRDSKKKAKGLPDNGNPLMETPRRGVTPDRKPQETPQQVTPMVTPSDWRMVLARLSDLEAWRETVEARYSPIAASPMPPPSVSSVPASTGRPARRYQMMIKRGLNVWVVEGQPYSCYGQSGIAPWLDAEGNPMPEGPRS